MTDFGLAYQTVKYGHGNAKKVQYLSVADPNLQLVGGGGGGGGGRLTMNVELAMF